MTTTLDAVDIVWKRLNESPIKAAITGGIYKKRPLNSSLEDVVINSLPISALQLQEGLVNVNIHVPNLVITNGTVQDPTQPNHARLKALATIAALSLNDVWIDDVHFTIQQQTVFEEPEINEHYVNFRLLFYAVNI